MGGEREGLQGALQGLSPGGDRALVPAFLWGAGHPHPAGGVDVVASCVGGN